MGNATPLNLHGLAKLLDIVVQIDTDTAGLRGLTRFDQA
jgi:hypothetical protein